jgi:hypothetical protein
MVTVRPGRERERRRCLVASVVLLLGAMLAARTVPIAAQSTDPLASWNDRAAKKAIVAFVARVTTPGEDFVAPEERIATFDNDGTLWPEQPLVQVQFALERLRALAAQNPALAQRQPFKAALDGDTDTIMRSGPRAAMEIAALTLGNMPQEAFEATARSFFRTATHPRFGVAYTQLAYRPMVELLQYLRANGFTTFICSGGGADFVRIVSQQMYGVPPHQVIGSSLRKTFVEQDGRWVLWRTGEVASVNDKEDKPVGIDLHVGQRPVFAAGNVRSGGDIAMLRYAQDRPGASFRLLVSHDDAVREFAYGETDHTSLSAAITNRWTIVSMKNDWARIFDVPDPHELQTSR